MRYLSMLLLLFCATAGAAQQPSGPASANTPLTLTKIMANPDWIAVTPEHPYWGADGGTVYYSQQPHGAPIATLHAVDLASGKTSSVADANASKTGSPESDYDKGMTREVYVAHGDVFVRDLKSG